jgi:hypothetical protein
MIARSPRALYGLFPIPRSWRGPLGTDDWAAAIVPA